MFEDASILYLDQCFGKRYLKLFLFSSSGHFTQWAILVEGVSGNINVKLF